MARNTSKFFAGTEFEQFEPEWRRAILNTWSGIAPDCGEMDDDCAVETVLDADRVEMMGNLKGEALVAWKKMIVNATFYNTLNDLAEDVMF